jgi:hypothetical protein
MRVDALIAFVPYGTPLAITTGTINSGVVDLLGPGVGQPPQNIIGAAAVYGAADAMGVGRMRMELAVATGNVAFSGGGTSINVQLQGAIDTGAGGGYAAGSWNTFAESGLILTAALGANQVIFRLPWLPPFPFNLRPRYLRLSFVVAGTYTAGAIAYALPTEGRDDYSVANAAKNFVVA